MSWSPDQYERFKDERSRPFFDLLDLVRPFGDRARERGPRCLDLGCGTGELTRTLHERVGATRTTGVDNSAEMLARAPKHDAAPPGLDFSCADLREPLKSDATYDLIFSNAALQWVPDHASLFADIAARLAERADEDAEGGGQLAVQMPANFDHPSHVVAREVAKEPAFATKLAGTAPPRPVLAIEAYSELLARLGFREQRVRMEVYLHTLTARQDVIEWVRGTLLTQFRARLDDAEYEAFVKRYEERLFEVLPDERPFLYPFKRVLLWARL